MNLALTSKFCLRVVLLDLPNSRDGVHLSQETSVKVEKFRQKCLFQNFRNWGFSERLYQICYLNIPVQVTNELFQKACEKGIFSLVKALLVDPRIDPAVDDNKALILSAEEGHEEVVWRLLFDENVNPAAQNSFALCFASINGTLLL